MYVNITDGVEKVVEQILERLDVLEIDAHPNDEPVDKGARIEQEYMMADITELKRSIRRIESMLEVLCVKAKVDFDDTY